ncbi:hypothetical protein MTR67_031366 [Solanum verrucosum]|uniref:Uncharacterized protein n=1 Tax=Solanum verrucosum TaxID=315347 RepID=A0AAF0ZDM8_SOLVR|nr:hypothetical protein MTR67_031366 [Solanum verrucosum]
MGVKSTTSNEKEATKCYWKTSLSCYSYRAWAPVPTKANNASIAARLQDFIRMSPPEFLRSQENKGTDATLVTWDCFTG